MPTFFSYAKINLGLQVLNRRNDGYHNIHSLILEIDLFDKIIINQSNKPSQLITICEVAKGFMIW